MVIGSVKVSFCQFSLFASHRIASYRMVSSGIDRFASYNFAR